MGIGYASGDDQRGAAVAAAEAAIQSPLLETSIDGAKGVLINVIGGPNLTLFDVNEAAGIIHNAADPEANIIFGAMIDENLGEDVRVVVIATGFDTTDEVDYGTMGATSRPSPGMPRSSQPMGSSSQSAPTPSVYTGTVPSIFGDSEPKVLRQESASPKGKVAFDDVDLVDIPEFMRSDKK